MYINLVLLISTPLLIYYSIRTWQRLTRRRLFQKMERAPFPVKYDTILSNYLPYKNLNPDEKKRFQAKVLYFLEDKNFTGVGNLVVTEEMRIFVAAEACLMITNLSGDIYPGLKNIYLMEDVFIPKDNPVNAMTGLPTHVARLGEAWKSGPVVLSWKSVSQGSSVIYHEFSHQLDQQDGSFDGTPKLGKNGNYGKWAQVMSKEFFHLKNLVEKHKHSDIDSYGATNEAEFFAVVTEYFFTRPKLLQVKHPAIYEIFQNYFKLDPAKW